MAQVKVFENNPFQENTYILYDETGECAIIDPGMYTAAEQNAVITFIKANNLKPALLLNTHCHIDHVLGNKLVYDIYELKPQFNEGELEVLESVIAYAPAMGMHYDTSPVPDVFLPESGSIKFGNTILTLIFAPGHSPAHLCFYDEAAGLLIGGDVLFRGSIGRADLPGGDYLTLIKNIEEKLFTLPDSCIVYPGHGPETTIGFEKRHNPFFN
jgi:glyoxylase-like metal-dependent hydrolase (beta-lactamase superfamily II)